MIETTVMLATLVACWALMQWVVGSKKLRARREAQQDKEWALLRAEKSAEAEKWRNRND